MVNQIERRIFLFSIAWKKDNNNLVMKGNKSLDSILKDKTQFEDSETTDLFLEKIEHQDLQKTPNTTFWKISKIRKSDLPWKFNSNESKSEPLGLKEDEGLYEPTHFAIFDGKIIVGEYNYYGKRFNTALSLLFSNFFKTNTVIGIKSVEIKPILKAEVYDLDSFTEISKFNISIATNYARLLANVGDASLQALFSAGKLVDNMNLTITISLGRMSKEDSKTKFKKIIAAFKKIFARDDWKGNLKNATVQAIPPKSEHFEKINLIEEYLMSQSKITKLDRRYRVIDSNSMFKRIIETYNSNIENIKHFISQHVIEKDD